MKITKHIRRDFHSVAWVMPQGLDFGGLGVPSGSKRKEKNSNMVMWHIKSTRMMSRTVLFQSFWKLVDGLFMVWNVHVVWTLSSIFFSSRWAFVIIGCPLIVRPASVNNFFKQNLLPFHLGKFYQTSQDLSLGGPLWKLVTLFSTMLSSSSLIMVHIATCFQELWLFFHLNSSIWMVFSL